MANVAQYWPRSIWKDLAAALVWLYARALPPVSNWQANALNPASAISNQGFEECGIVSTADLTTYATTPVENIVLDAPAGVLPDSQAGPDGFPINYSPLGLPQGNLFLNFIVNPSNLTVLGRCFSLLQAIVNYRVDIFAKTDNFYYKGSSSLTDTGLGYGIFSVAGVTSTGTVIAVLYPSSVSQPGVGSNFAALPAGWLAHSNTGVGQKLTSYKAQILTKTDIEYLKEDSVPVIVQDAHHARAGSSVVPGTTGVLSMQILYNDPVAGWTTQFDLLQTLASYTLPRSEVVPTSDPNYVANLTTTNTAALQNRAWTYSTALALIAYAMSANFAASKKAARRTGRSRIPTRRSRMWPRIP